MKMYRALLTITIFIACGSLFATSVDTSCSVHGPDLYSYSASLEKNKTYRFELRGEKAETHQLGVLVNSCEKAAGKFLMVGFGVNEYSIDSSTYTTAYTDTLDPQKCKIENNTLNLPINENDRQSEHKAKTDFLKNCVETTISHNSSRPLKYRAQQQGCTVKKLSEQKAIIEGGFCFFKIYKDSEFVVSHRIKENCLERDFLQSQKISLREINAATTFGVASKPTGMSQDLELLPSKLFNFMLEPTSEHFTISDDWGRDVPQLPANYTVPEVSFGDIKLKNLRDAAILKFPLLVDNFHCQKSCLEEICTSSCNYSKPVVAEVVFSEIINGKKAYLKSWYDGSVAIPNWQGLLNMPAQVIKGVQLGEEKTYQLDLIFRDPKVDFTMYNKSVTPLFMPLPGIPTMDFAASLLNGIPTIGSTKPIPEITDHDILPDYGVIRDFGQYSGSDGADGIQTISKFRYWPQYFDKVCSDNKCFTISSRPYMTLSLNFTLGGMDVEGNFKIKDITEIKKSRFENNKMKKISELPKVVCPWDGLE